MDTQTGKVLGTSLSLEARMAWLFSLAMVDQACGVKNSPHIKEWNDRIGQAKRTEAMGVYQPFERNKALQKGLAELSEKGLIKTDRDGHRDLFPTAVFPQLLDDDTAGSRLITTDRN